MKFPNVYQSEAILSPVSEGTAINAEHWGLASLAINIKSQPAGNSTKALKKLRTLSFYEDNILPNIFVT